LGIRKALLEALPLDRDRDQAKDLLIDPPQERAVQLDQLLAGHVRQDRASLALDHQIPHGRNGGLAAPFVGYLGVVGDKVKFPAPVMETPLLDFMAAHEVLAGVKSLRDGRWAGG